MVDGPGELLAQGRRWLRWANEDLVAARHNALDTDVAPRIACGLAQQAAEKAIKALVVLDGVDPPKSHNLLRLVRMLTDDVADPILGVDLENLTRWAIEGRYPEDLDEAGPEDANRAVETANHVLTIVAVHIEQRDN